MTVVGVSGDVKKMGLDAPVRTEMYLPYQQVSYNASSAPAELVVRRTGEPLGLVASIRRAVTDVAPNQPASTVKTLDEVLAAETSARRVGTWLIGGFAALSLLLAAVGSYGVLSSPRRSGFPNLAFAWRSASSVCGNTILLKRAPDEQRTQQRQLDVSPISADFT